MSWSPTFEQHAATMRLRNANISASERTELIIRTIGVADKHGMPRISEKLRGILAELGERIPVDRLPKIQPPPRLYANRKPPRLAPGGAGCQRFGTFRSWTLHFPGGAL